MKRAMIHVDIEAESPEALADALGRVTDAAMNADARVVRVISGGARSAFDAPDVTIEGAADLERERNRLGRIGRRLDEAERTAKGKGVID